MAHQTQKEKEEDGETAPCKKQKIEGGGGGGGGGKEEDEGEESADSLINSRIDWYQISSLKERLLSFRHEIIWPHIFDEESQHLQYMYFLDYLRVSDLQYKHQIVDSRVRSIENGHDEASCDEFEDGA